jgi:hypothetical protein
MGRSPLQVRERRGLPTHCVPAEVFC